MQKVKPHIINNEHVVKLRMSDGETATRTLRNDNAPDITWTIPISRNDHIFYKYDLSLWGLCRKPSGKSSRTNNKQITKLKTTNVKQKNNKSDLFLYNILIYLPILCVINVILFTCLAQLL